MLMVTSSLQNWKTAGVWHKISGFNTFWGRNGWVYGWTVGLYMDWSHSFSCFLKIFWDDNQFITSRTILQDKICSQCERNLISCEKYTTRQTAFVAILPSYLWFEFLYVILALFLSCSSCIMCMCTLWTLSFTISSLCILMYNWDDNKVLFDSLKCVRSWIIHLKWRYTDFLNENAAVWHLWLWQHAPYEFTNLDDLRQNQERTFHFTHSLPRFFLSFGFCTKYFLPLNSEASKLTSCMSGLIAEY